MINKEDCYSIGNIARKHGYKGQVSIVLDVDQPSAYFKMESILVEINGNLIPFFIEDIRPQKNQYVLIKFEGVDSEEEANAILRKNIYLPLDVLPPLKDDQFYYHEIIGYSVEDSNHGKIGEVKEVVSEDTNPLLQIDFNGIEILIPINDETILKVDKNSKHLNVVAPVGLIDLYL